MKKLGLGLCVLLCGSSAFGQQVISARSGLIHYVEGQVTLDGKPVEVKIASFTDMKENAELRSADGRAEVLLNPGAFLRLGENSAVRMVSNKLTDSRLEFLSGEAVVEADSSAAQGEEIVTVLYHDTAVRLRKAGIYRFDSDPAALRVYSGEAEIGDQAIKAGKMIALDNPQSAEKFDNKDGDALTRWSKRRAEYISMANVYAAKYVKDSGGNWKSSNWFYNSYFGMFTFIPGNGYFRSPYGYAYYSPFAVYRIYQPRVYSAPVNYGSGMRAGISQPTPQASVSMGSGAPRAASVMSPSAPAPAAGASRVGRSAGAGRSSN
jgi:FecR protein